MSQTSAGRMYTLPCRNDWYNNHSFRSRHPGGLQFALADGSVHFIPNAISLTVYRQLATNQGGEVVELP